MVLFLLIWTVVQLVLRLLRKQDTRVQVRRVSGDVSSRCLASRRGIVLLALGGVDGKVGAAAARAPGRG